MKCIYCNYSIFPDEGFINITDSVLHSICAEKWKGFIEVYERQLESNKKSYFKNKDKRNEKLKLKYKTDPAHRARILAGCKRYRERLNLTNS